MEGTIHDHLEIVHIAQNSEVDKMKDKGESIELMKKKLILFSEIRVIIQTYYQIKHQVNAV